MASNQPATAHLQAAVQDAFTEAVYLASGYDISNLKHCSVQLSNNFRSSGDMKTNVAASLFLMHMALSNEISSEDEMATDVAVMEVITTSRSGLQRPRRYADGNHMFSCHVSRPVFVHLI